MLVKYVIKILAFSDFFKTGLEKHTIGTVIATYRIFKRINRPFEVNFEHLTKRDLDS